MRENFRDHRPQILSSLKPGDVLIAFFVLYFFVVVALCSRGNRKTWKEVHNYCTVAEVWRETLKLTSDADARLKCSKQRMLVGNYRIYGACVNTRTVP